MRLKPAILPPWIICGTVVALAWGFLAATRTIPSFDFLQRLEWITFDWRVRNATTDSTVNATNLGFVFISDDSIQALMDGSLDYRVGLYWPRHVYGRLVQELNAQGAKAVGFDVLFAERRPDHPAVTNLDGTLIESDIFFSQSLKHAGNVILASEKGLLPPELFRTNSWGLGDVSAKRESDGILRRAKAFDDYYVWHHLLLQAARVQGWDLRRARVEGPRLIIPSSSQERIFTLDRENNYDQVRLYEELTGQQAPRGVKPLAKAFTTLRVWDLGIMLGARELGLDLSNPEVRAGFITLYGKNGVRRRIPVDSENRFYINWSITPRDPRLIKESVESLLMQERGRRSGETEGITNRWKDRLVVVGSTAIGNDLTDLGATPLEKETFLTSRFWNTANSIITDRFVTPASPWLEVGLILFLAVLAGLLT